MNIQEIKSFDRNKYKIIRNKNTTLEINNVKKNVEIFLQTQQKKIQLANIYQYIGL